MALHLPPARVAKLVDALCSGRSIRKVVLVRIQSRAQKPPCRRHGGFLFWKRAKLALLSGQNEKTNPAQRDEVFVTPLVGVSG